MSEKEKIIDQIDQLNRKNPSFEEIRGKKCNIYSKKSNFFGSKIHLERSMDNRKNGKLSCKGLKKQKIMTGLNSSTRFKHFKKKCNFILEKKSSIGKFYSKYSRKNSIDQSKKQYFSKKLSSLTDKYLDKNQN